jgi:AAHS family 4-hydroxybenzoate transporter-like MFS transporter
MTQTIDVTQFIDRQPVSRFLVGVVLLCTLVTLADGFNISLVAFAAPAIVKEWHLNRAALGPLLSASLVAGLIGPFLFGLLGDRIGAAMRSSVRP